MDKKELVKQIKELHEAVKSTDKPLDEIIDIIFNKTKKIIVKAKEIKKEIEKD